MDLTKINPTVINSLLEIFDKIFTDGHLLVFDNKLSSLINYLIPFQQFKARGKFDKMVWVNDASNELLLQHQNIVVLLDNDTKFKIPDHCRVVLIVRNLTKTRLYDINKDLSLNLSFTDILNRQSNEIRAKHIKVFNWRVNGIVVEENIISLQDEQTVDRYFKEPLYCINDINHCIINLIEKFGIKINNVYSIGVNSNLLYKLFNIKLDEYLNGNMNNLQQEFYLNNLKGTHDLVIMERGIDLLPLVMNQLSYIGLIDDLVGISIDLIQLDNQPPKLHDELFDNLKWLNFSLIGSKLNKLAKLLKNQYNSNVTDLDLEEIKKLVKNLSDLNKQQDLVKKHTTISEYLLNKIKQSGDNKYNEYELFLNFENDVFQMTYKSQILQLERFLTMNLKEDIIINSLVIVSLINNGIKTKDLDDLKQSMVENYGIQIIWKVENLLKYKLLKLSDVESIIQNEEEGLGNIDIHNNNYTLLNKFWDLHPEEKTESIDSISDYESPNFSLPSNTIPLIIRLIESLYTRQFLVYKPINKITKQPSWENLDLKKMFKGPINETKTAHITNQTLLVYLGGITWSEISCIKYLNEKFKAKGINNEFFIITNGIIRNSDLQNCIVP